MSSSEPSTTRPEPGESPTAAGGQSASAPLPLTAEQLARWADLVARGEAELPGGLPSAQEEELLQQVRWLRRGRLVQFIAAQIAQDIRRSAGSD